METVLMLLLFSGCGNDLLDAIPSDGYWQMYNVPVTAATMMTELGVDPAAADQAAAPNGEADPRAKIRALVAQLGAKQYSDREAAQEELIKLGREAQPELEEATKHEDPEIAVRARNILEEIMPKVQVREHWRQMMEPPEGRQVKAVRRLMAIRTIGEKKYKQCLPLLRKLTESKVPFEADYARRAIARIEDRKLEHEPFDMKLRERDLAAVPQEIAGVGQFIQLPGVGVAEMTVNMNVGERAYNSPRWRMRSLLEMPVRVGNMRLEHATVFVSEEIGDDETSWFGAILRGSYDEKALRDLASDQNMEQQKIADVDVFVGREVTIALVSDSMVVFFARPRRHAEMPVESVLKAVVSGEGGGIEKNEAIQALLKKVDRKNDYAVLLTSKAMQSLPVLAPVRQMTLEVTRGPKEQQGRLTATGDDAGQVEQAGRLAQAGWQAFLMDGRRHVPAAVIPLIETLEKTKFTMAEGVVTVELKGDMAGAMEKIVAAEFLGNLH